MMLKRILSILCAFLMLLPLLIACSGKPDSGKTGTGAPSGGGTAAAVSGTVTEDKGLVSVDSVPALDFDGESFDILQYTKNNWFYVEDQNGEQLNDIVYERNRTLEERFNITIGEPNTLDWDDLKDLISTLVPTGDDTYDMVSQSLRRTETTLSKGVFRNVLDLPYIDIDNPWYTQGLEDAVVAGKLLFLTGDYTLSYTAGTVVVYFNKAKWDDYIHTQNDLYQIVRDGKWTLYRMMGYCADLYNDVNGNSKRDEDDFYGFEPYFISCVDAWVYGSNVRRIRIVGHDYEIVQDMLEEPLIDLYTKLRNFMAYSDGSAYGVYDIDYGGNSLFLSGHALFSSFSVGEMTTPEMVAMEDDFGVLPVPKWNEDQQEYYTNVDNGAADVIGVLKTVKNTELVGAVIEAMSATSYTYVMPLYCNTVLELRAARDPETSEMLRMIMDTRVMDWETLYSGYDGWATRQRKLVNTFNCPELVSGIAERVNAVQKIYENIMEILWYLE